jgi:hypothetical protein
MRPISPERFYSPYGELAWSICLLFAALARCYEFLRHADSSVPQLRWRILLTSS